jgi:hypothetical protein
MASQAILALSVRAKRSEHDLLVEAPDELGMEKIHAVRKRQLSPASSISCEIDGEDC